MLDHSEKKIEINENAMGAENACSRYNQHFIFNALNAIKYATLTDQEKACELIDDFSKYLRYHMNVGKHSAVALSDEMKSVYSYLNIQKYRYPDIHIHIDLQKEGFYIPVMSVQALVENAVSHGVCQKNNSGNIYIRSIQIKGYDVVEIEDDGFGMFDLSSQKFKSTFGGVADIRNRVRKEAGGEFIISTEAGLGTKVRILLPENWWIL